MENRIITIENEMVSLPDEVKMSICEIANLFDIFYQTAKRNIRAIEKLGIAYGNYSMSCAVEGQKVYPEYYGIEMITAIAFRVQSTNAEIVRKWFIEKVAKMDLPQAIPFHLKSIVWN